MGAGFKPISAQWTISAGGDLRVPPEGAHTGAPLRFAGIFLTATRYQIFRRVQDDREKRG